MPQESERLKLKAQTMGWSEVFLDIDGTAAKSNDKWPKAWAHFAHGICQLVEADPVQVAHEAEEMNNRLFEEYVVGPRKYPVIAKELAEKYGVPVDSAKEIMHEAMKIIYWDVPPLYPATMGQIETIWGADMKVAFVTQSPNGRVLKMMREWGLENTVNYYSQTTFKHKDKVVWRRALEGEKVNGHQVVMAGDNLNGDIVAAGEAGIEFRIWVEPEWKMHALGTLPPGVPKIGNISELVPTMLKM